MPITHSILTTAANHPDRPAIVGEHARLSYGELAEDGRRVIAAARHLLAQAPNLPTPAPETQGAPVIAVSSTSAFEAARIMAGLAGYRAVSATIDPRWPVDHQRHVIAEVGIGLVTVDDDQADARLRSALGPDWGGVVVPAQRFREIEAQVQPAEPPQVRDADEPYLMLFSSGTTSSPKAFLKTRGQYRANFAVSSSYLEPLPGVATLAPGAFAYSLTLYAAVECLASGGEVHLADELSLPGLGKRVAQQRITRIVTVPAVLRGIIAQATRGPKDFAGLELIVVGGANLPNELRKDLAEVLPHVRLISYYGAAEIGFIGDARGDDSTWNQIYDGIQVEIRDDEGNTVPDGEIGTLWVLAESRSDDYIAGTADVHLLDERGWATVEDQGRIAVVDGKRQLQLLGRKGDIINVGGHKVALPEVTRAYAGLTVGGQHREAVAVGVPDTALGTAVALVVEVGDLVPADSGDGVWPDSQEKSGSLEQNESVPVLPEELSKASLREHGRKHLAPQFVPSKYYVVEALPRTVGGKVRATETVGLIETGGKGVVRL